MSNEEVNLTNDSYLLNIILKLFEVKRAKKKRGLTPLIRYRN